MCMQMNYELTVGTALQIDDVTDLDFDARLEFRGAFDLDHG